MKGSTDANRETFFVKKKYEDMIVDNEKDIIMSSCCHSVNVLIQKHFPECLPYLAQVISPMQAHCQLIKQKDPEAKVVFVGPCISKKSEAEMYPGYADIVLTFEELSELRLNKTEEKIPLFTEVLEVLGEVPVSCEIKTAGAEFDSGFLEEVYQIIKDYKGLYNVISFNPFVLEWFKNNHPEVIRGQLSAGNGHLGVKGILGWGLSNLLLNYKSKPDFISYKWEDKSLGFLLCRFYGTRLCAWTVHSMEDVEKAAFEGFSTFVGENFDITEV